MHPGACRVFNSVTLFNTKVSDTV